MDGYNNGGMNVDYTGNGANAAHSPGAFAPNTATTDHAGGGKKRDMTEAALDNTEGLYRGRARNKGSYAVHNDTTCLANTERIEVTGARWAEICAGQVPEMRACPRCIARGNAPSVAAAPAAAVPQVPASIPGSTGLFRGQTMSKGTYAVHNNIKCLTNTGMVEVAGSQWADICADRVAGLRACPRCVNRETSEPREPREPRATPRPASAATVPGGATASAGPAVARKRGGVYLGRACDGEGAFLVHSDAQCSAGAFHVDFIGTSWASIREGHVEGLRACAQCVERNPNPPAVDYEQDAVQIFGKPTGLFRSRSKTKGTFAVHNNGTYCLTNSDKFEVTGVSWTEICAGQVPDFRPCPRCLGREQRGARSYGGGF